MSVQAPVGITTTSMFLWGAVGGMLPTLGRMAGTYGADFSAPLPHWSGVLLAVGLYAVIGAIMARAVGNAEMKQALFAGIAAPAIVLSVYNGASETKNDKADVAKQISNFAKTNTKDLPPELKQILNNRNTGFIIKQPSTFMNDFIWALGGAR